MTTINPIEEDLEIDKKIDVCVSLTVYGTVNISVPKHFTERDIRCEIQKSLNNIVIDSSMTDVDVVIDNIDYE